MNSIKKHNNKIKSGKRSFKKDNKSLQLKRPFVSDNGRRKNKRIKFYDEDDEGLIEEVTNANHQDSNNVSDIGTKWYEELNDLILNTDEVLEMKHNELIELTNLCKQCYESERMTFQKKNPHDAKWLMTALAKGASKDRANAGALLVQTNPLANLSALETLVSLTKNANRASVDAVDVVAELFINSLLPPNRKLIPLTLRGANWRKIRGDTDLDMNFTTLIFAYWHFEAELKEHYFTFLKNLLAAIQQQQDVTKNQAIVYTAKLLNYAPEKEQMLLSMLVNKLGDPSRKVASKALYHLTDVSYRHPNMCEEITNETEKFLFRNNISEHAQHFALCFLGQIAPNGNSNVCAKLIHICFSYFNIIIKRGAINTRIMQAILRCLRRAIVDGKCTENTLLTKDTEDTLYRLIHLAEIQISIQALALLLQIIIVRPGSYDRFYNALYQKLMDVNLLSIGSRIAAQFLHIIHRAIFMDANGSRAQAFIKRLLQITYYFPVHITCGCLIIINKLLKTRPELWRIDNVKLELDNIDKAAMLDSKLWLNEEEHFKDAPEEDATDNAIIIDAKPIDSKNQNNTVVKHEKKIKYNPYYRVPAYAGAELTQKTELLKLLSHYHPTVQVFTQSIIDNRYINFYGDPLRDFSLGQFLERFSFKNPKKIKTQQSTDNDTAIDDHQNVSMVKLVNKKSSYQAHGSRGMPIKNLTRENCTENEQFIFQYLEQKRLRQSHIEFKKHDKDDDEESITDSIDDAEFDDYLDGLDGKRKRAGDEDEDDIDFMKELESEMHLDGKKKKKKKQNNAEDGDFDDDADGDDTIWDMEDVDDTELNETNELPIDNEADEFGSDDDDAGSISLDDLNEEDSDIFEDDTEDEDEFSDDDDVPKNKKVKKGKPLSGKDFQKILKNTNDTNSLFAAAEDFSEMLEETGRLKGHGTLGEIFNKDKSSEQQMLWEEKRMKSHRNYQGKRQSFKKPFKKQFKANPKRFNDKFVKNKNTKFTKNFMKNKRK